jgi:HlyD family secretion protein
MTTKKKGGRRWLLYVLILAVLAIAATVYFKYKSAPKGEEVETAKSAVRTIKETVSASGRIYPETEVIISSDVSGEIVELYVEEGDSVKMGQTLLRIDPEAYQSTVERGRANLNNAKAQMANSKAQIETIKSQKIELETQLKQAQRVHNRNKELFAEGVISQIQFDESLAQVESITASIRSSDANIRGAEESAKAAEFNVMSSEASLKEMLTNLNRTTIKAPNAGIISSLSIEKGERVVGTAQMTGTEIMRISDLTTMETQVEVTENDILKVTLGDETEIEVDAYIDRKFKGRVTEIANSASNAASGTGNSLNTDQVTNFIVKIRLDPTSYSDLLGKSNKYPFRPGMSASVEIVTDVKNNVLTVPIQAVTMRNLAKDGDKEDFKEVVFVYEADTARMIPVVTGAQDNEFIYLTEGLSVDQEIISGPYSTLSKIIENGTLLRPKENEEDKKKK